VVELVGHQDLRHLDGRRVEQMREELFGGVVSGLVEGRVGELAADGLVELSERGDPDRFGELVVQRRQELLGDPGHVRGERAGLAAEVFVRIVIRERELELLRVAGLRPDERIGQARDRVVLAELEVRVAAHRRHLLAVELHVEIDGEYVVVLCRPLNGLELRVMLAHPGDGLLDLLVGDRGRLDGDAGRGRVPERDLRADRDGRRVLERLSGLELAHFDVRTVEPVDVLETRDLLEGLVDEIGRGVLPEVVGTVRALVQRARRLARPEAGDLGVLHVLLERAVARTLESAGVDLDGQRDDGAGLALDGVSERADGLRLGRGRGGRRLLCRHGVIEFRALRPMLASTPMYFYEIHEPDDDLGTAVLLSHEDRFSPEEFFRMVKKARDLVKDSFEEASLPEAIANELERSSHFVHVTDERLLASVSVGDTDQDTFLVASDEAVRTVYVEGDEPKPNGDRPN
jgi:hypothetical protein